MEIGGLSFFLKKVQTKHPISVLNKIRPPTL